MKLLHVAASYLPARRYGGTVVSVHGLCKALAARGHDIHVFTTSVDGPDDSPVPHGQPVVIDGVTVWYFQSRRGRRLYYAPALAAALRARVAEFDAVHTHAIYLWPLWAASRAAARAGVPHVISPRGMLEKELIERRTALWKALLIGFVERPRLEAAAAIHVTSRRERDEALRFGFRFPEFHEVPNGVDGDAAGDPGVAPARGAPSTSSPMVLFLGRVNWKKGLDRLIAALAAAPSASLVIAGNDEDGYRPTLEAIAIAHGVAARVSYAGAVYGAEKAALIDRASALVLPSYSENFGNVVLEAWARACPVILTPEVGLADAVARCGGGWVADGSPATLGRAIEEAVTNEPLGRRKGELGRAEVERAYTWDAVAARMEQVYLAAGVNRA